MKLLKEIDGRSPIPEGFGIVQKLDFGFITIICRKPFHLIFKFLYFLAHKHQEITYKLIHSITDVKPYEVTVDWTKNAVCRNKESFPDLSLDWEAIQGLFKK